ncbi:hypothetical protein HZA56_14110 [Candidatus Poribacteria bacterium]|nr:hypothetical protein [Candidatus Poribacteria bacterium]
MPNSTTTEKQPVKVFGRADFDKVKKLQARKKPASREEIIERVGFGKETVRKAMIAPTWAQYRKNDKQALRRRAERREAAKNDLRLPGYTTDDGSDLLIAPNEGEPNPHFKMPGSDRTREYIGWSVALVVVVAVVLFWIL